jgi:hypothetical protein
VYDDYVLRCIVCKVEFSESDIDVTEAMDILICDLCALKQYETDKKDKAF